LLPGEERNYLGPYNAGWSGANNLATFTKYFTNGPYSGKVSSIKNPDGTMQFFEFATNSLGTLRTNIVYSGAPDSGGTTITNGTTTVSVTGLAGQTHSRLVYDVASGLLIDSEVYTLDDRNRTVFVAYLDGTSMGMSYECCGLSAVTNRDGTVTTYEYDDLKRKTAESIWVGPSAAITTYYQYDANGSIRAITRQGTNGSSILLKGYSYDLAGRVAAETNSLGMVTSYSYGVPNSNGERTNITVFASGTADATTRTEVFYRDGRLKRVTGSAVHPVSYTYNVNSSTSFDTDETVLDESGNTTLETRTTGTDFADRLATRIFRHGTSPSTIYSYSDYNPKGLWRERNSSGHTLYTNNTLGQLEYTVRDLNQNATIDFTGTDRISRTTSDVITNYGTTVRRTRSYAWPSNSVDAAQLLRTVEVSADGLQSWETTLGQTARSITVYAGAGTRYTTNIAPDATYTVSQFQHGRLLSLTRYTPTGGQLSATTYGFDEHGRQTSVTDARNGTTTYTFDNEGRTTSVRTPAPSGGANPQVTTNLYDNLGRIWKVGLPDGGSVTNEYYSTGELKKTYGTRTYPVEFTYDTAGRLRTNTTWQSFADNSGKAATAWNYDSRSGLLTSKKYADNTGPTYTYHTTFTPAGLLSSRPPAGSCPGSR
jgi:YD repeat-containing protein